MTTDRLVRTAIHEAGHAVAALLCGMEVHAVHVKPFGPYGRRTLGACILVTPPRGAAGLLVVQAGDAAVELLEAGMPHPERPARTPWLWQAMALQQMAEGYPVEDAVASDGQKAAALAPTRPEPRQVALLSAREMLRVSWRAVYAVASELLLEGQVEGSRVRELFDRHSRAPATTPVDIDGAAKGAGAA